MASASVDKESYAYGETITFRYTIRNEGTETTAVWGSSSCKIDLPYGSLLASRDGWGCTADVDSTGPKP